MATKLQIWNRALNHIGELRISGLTEDSVNRRLLEANYEDDKRAVLEMHTWKFAREHSNLATNATAPEFGYAISYELPVDFIRMVYFNNTIPEYRDQKAFEIVGSELHTDETTAKITYIKDITSAGSFSAGFVEALSLYMAKNLAYYRTKSVPLSDNLETKFQKALSAAKKADGSADFTPHQGLINYPNIAARFGRYRT